jgi:Zn-dependent peptidase ImmA (M78 family)
MRKTWDIYGQKVTVELKKGPLQDHTGRQLAGYFDQLHNKIVIDSTMPKDHITKTLYHELGHALKSRLGIFQTSLSEDLHELIVEGYANFIYENFNPKK